MMWFAWFNKIESIAPLALFLTLFVILPAQIFLCFKMKNLIVRLLPVILLSGFILFYIVLGLTSTGWDSFYSAFFAVLTGLMLLPCGIVWGIWAVVRSYKKKAK